MEDRGSHTRTAGPATPARAWITILYLLPSILVLAGCDAFRARTPEPPVAEGGTFLQPDTPEQVVANVQAAVAELNPTNYRRSLAEGLVYEPAAEAAQRYGVWAGWNMTSEASYFNALAAAAAQGAGHQLVLTDSQLSIVTDDRYVYDAAYTLTVQHRQPNVPTTVEGRLVWELTQGADGLWRITRWTDRARGSAPSWSTLKAEFVQ